FIGGQPRHDGGDFFGRAQALDGNGGNDLFKHVGTNGANHVGADVTRRDGVDGNPLVGDFLGQRHAETVYAGLGGGIVGLAELPLMAIDRTDVDDAAPLAFEHVFEHLLGDVEQAVQVGVDDGTPVVERHFAEQTVAGDARVVHEHIDGAEL